MRLRDVALGVIGCALVATCAHAAAAPRRHAGINAREHRQAQRIRQGARSGELTAAERDRLVADEAAIRAEERVYRRTGGGLDAPERRDLQRDLNREAQRPPAAVECRAGAMSRSAGS
jgi:hypothetical protein